MNRQASALAAAIAATLGTASVAQGATAVATLTGVTSYSGNGSSAGNITSSTATFEYDDVTNLLTQTGGTFNVRFTTAPTSTLFRHSITGLVLGNGAAAAASTFTCTEGNFGGNVGASLCGNYTFGANFVNNSTVAWGPGTAFARTIGGDDMAIGAQQSLAAYDNFTEVSWVGTTLTLSNAVCNPAAPGNANGCAAGGGFNTGYTWILNATQPATTTAVDDADSTTRNVARIVPVLANDQGMADPITITADAAGTNVQANSTIVVAGSGGPGAGVTVTYTPNLAAGLGGPITDTFTYTANGETATVTMTIDNVVPNAVGGDVAISTVGVAPDGLTGSFTAPGTGGSLGDSGAATPTNGGRGNATIAGNTITYTVTDDTFFTGTDSFTYSISDPDGAGPAETSGPVTVNVTIADASPSLNPASAETNLDTPVAVNLVLNAGNGSPAQHTFAIDSDATNGGCTLSGATVTYTPDAGFTGNDSCVASVTDGDGDSAQATVSVEVVDLLPVLNDASTETRRDTAVAVDLSFTLGDGTLAQHSFALVTDATNGSCAVDGAGTVTYTPNAGYTGSDSCVVSLTDVNASQDTATVNINVTSGTGLRENDGGSSADWLILSLLGGSALIRRRRRS